MSGTSETVAYEAELGLGFRGLSGIEFVLTFAFEIMTAYDRCLWDIQAEALLLPAPGIPRKTMVLAVRIRLRFAFRVAHVSLAHW